MKRKTSKYLMLDYLRIHLRTGDAETWYSDLPKEKKQLLKDEIRCLSVNSQKPAYKYRWERKVFFELVEAFGKVND